MGVRTLPGPGGTTCVRSWAGHREERPDEQVEDPRRGGEPQAHEVVGHPHLDPVPGMVDGPQDPSGDLLRRRHRRRRAPDVAGVGAGQLVDGRVDTARRQVARRGRRGGRGSPAGAGGPGRAPPTCSARTATCRVRRCARSPSRPGRTCRAPASRRTGTTCRARFTAPTTLVRSTLLEDVGRDLLRPSVADDAGSVHHHVEPTRRARPPPRRSGVRPRRHRRRGSPTGWRRRRRSRTPPRPASARPRRGRPGRRGRPRRTPLDGRQPDAAGGAGHEHHARWRDAVTA